MMNCNTERVFELIGLAREFTEQGDPVFLNYLSLARQRMDQDPDVTVCPRCHTAGPPFDADITGSGFPGYHKCPDCGYVFQGVTR